MRDIVYFIDRNLFGRLVVRVGDRVTVVGQIVYISFCGVKTRRHINTVFETLEEAEEWRDER